MAIERLRPSLEWKVNLNCSDFEKKTVEIIKIKWNLALFGEYLQDSLQDSGEFSDVLLYGALHTYHAQKQVILTKTQVAINVCVKCCINSL